MAPWLIVQHADFEGPGLIAEQMESRGLAYRMCRPDRGDALPPSSELPGIVVMGGPMGVYEADRYPFLAAEQTLLAELVTLGRPVLGVCLGSQLLAAALGARVQRGPELEVGTGWVELSAEGRRDPVLGETQTERLPVAHWHQDTFNLPPGTVHLASSALYPQQAFRSGRLAYGWQFHCELTPSLAAAWRPHLPAGVSLTEADVETIAATGRRLIGRFLDLARSTAVHRA